MARSDAHFAALLCSSESLFDCASRCLCCNTSPDLLWISRSSRRAASSFCVQVKLSSKINVRQATRPYRVPPPLRQLPHNLAECLRLLVQLVGLGRKLLVQDLQLRVPLAQRAVELRDRRLHLLALRDGRLRLLAEPGHDLRLRPRLHHLVLHQRHLLTRPAQLRLQLAQLVDEQTLLLLVRHHKHVVPRLRLAGRPRLRPQHTVRRTLRLVAALRLLPAALLLCEEGVALTHRLLQLAAEGHLCLELLGDAGELQRRVLLLLLAALEARLELCDARDVLLQLVLELLQLHRRRHQLLVAGARRVRQALAVAVVRQHLCRHAFQVALCLGQLGCRLRKLLLVCLNENFEVLHSCDVGLIVCRLFGADSLGFTQSRFQRLHTHGEHLVRVHERRVVRERSLGTRRQQVLPVAQRREKFLVHREESLRLQVAEDTAAVHLEVCHHGGGRHKQVCPLPHGTRPLRVPRLRLLDARQRRLLQRPLQLRDARTQLGVRLLAVGRTALCERRACVLHLELALRLDELLQHLPVLLLVLLRALQRRRTRPALLLQHQKLRLPPRRLRLRVDAPLPLLLALLLERLAALRVEAQRVVLRCDLDDAEVALHKQLVLLSKLLPQAVHLLPQRRRVLRRQQRLELHGLCVLVLVHHAHPLLQRLHLLRVVQRRRRPNAHAAVAAGRPHVPADDALHDARCGDAVPLPVRRVRRHALHHLVSLRVPDDHDAVLVRAPQRVALHPRQTRDRRLVHAELLQQGTLRRVPHADHPVLAAAPQLVVRQRRKGQHRARVPLHRAPRRIPHAHGAVVAAGYEALEGHRKAAHGVLVPAERGDLLHAVGRPLVDLPVLPRRVHARPVGHDGQHRTRVVQQLLQQLVSLVREHAHKPVGEAHPHLPAARRRVRHAVRQNARLLQADRAVLGLRRPGCLRAADPERAAAVAGPHLLSVGGRHGAADGVLQRHLCHERHLLRTLRRGARRLARRPPEARHPVVDGRERACGAGRRPRRAWRPVARRRGPRRRRVAHGRNADAVAGAPRRRHHVAASILRLLDRRSDGAHH
eukprot:Rhum_TRINITY_DN11958_c0_g2::Rhum_TRINITY_DN11958_c0_g2_i2::g.48182::m.48182